jgi:hypothetical protein
MSSGRQQHTFSYPIPKSVQTYSKDYQILQEPLKYIQNPLSQISAENKIGIKSFDRSFDSDCSWCQLQYLCFASSKSSPNYI